MFACSQVDIVAYGIPGDVSVKESDRSGKRAVSSAAILYLISLNWPVNCLLTASLPTRITVVTLFCTTCRYHIFEYYIFLETQQHRCQNRQQNTEVSAYHTNLQINILAFNTQYRIHFKMFNCIQTKTAPNYLKSLVHRHETLRNVCSKATINSIDHIAKHLRWTNFSELHKLYGMLSLSL